MKGQKTKDVITYLKSIGWVFLRDGQGSREGRTAMSKRTFEVTVERDGRWWVFEIPELGTGGQAHNLAEVEYEARGVAAMWLNVAPETVAVAVAVKGQDTTLAEWIAAERDEEDARQAQARAAARRRAVVRALRAQGYTAPDTGRVLGISKQRVYQIERAEANARAQ